MQIPQNLPQFEEKTLIIISTVHETRYLAAHRGNLEDLHSFKVEKITYSDREGHFLKSAFGRVFGSGSVYEKPKEQELIEFATEFEKQTKKVVARTEPEKIILACPDYAQNLIAERLPDNTKNKIRLTLSGNYYKTKNTKLLELIQDKESDHAAPEVMSEEAKKILEKGEQ